jgi:hypothetical protein
MAAEGDDDDPAGVTAEEAFAAMTHHTCPPLAETLVAVAAVWRPVSLADLDARLDQLARPLFAVEPTGEERASALAAHVSGTLRPDAHSADGLFLDEVLASGRGHPVLIAAVAAELGRRAGWAIAVYSSPTAWYAGLLDGGMLWLVDPTSAAGGPETPTIVRRHCAHELAYAVLTGLAERLAGPRNRVRARELREHLALFEAPEHPGQTLLGALWTPDGMPR